MLRGIITIFTVFMLLLSAAKASEDYYLGKLGKPVEELPFDGGKYYLTGYPPLIEGLYNFTLYATPITSTLYGITLKFDNISKKKCMDQLSTSYRELAIKHFGNDPKIILNWEEQMVDGRLYPSVHVTDFNRSSVFLGSKEIDVGSSLQLSDLSGQRVIVICHSDWATIKFIDFKAIKRRVVEVYKNNPVLQNLLRGNYAPSENNDSPIQSPFGITLGKALASGSINSYMMEDDLYKIKPPVSHDIFSDYYAWTTSLSDTVYNVMGVKLFTDQLQCKTVMNSITKSLHTNLGGKLRPWMTHDDITIDQVLEKVANGKITIKAQCTPSSEFFLIRTLVRGGQNEFAGSLRIYLKDYNNIWRAESCVINPLAIVGCD